MQIYPFVSILEPLFSLLLCFSQIKYDILLSTNSQYRLQDKQKRTILAAFVKNNSERDSFLEELLMWANIYMKEIPYRDVKEDINRVGNQGHCCFWIGKKSLN